MTAASSGSYCGLCLVQGAIVLLPRAVRPSWLARLRAHWPFVAGPAAALTGVTFLPRVASPSRAVSPRLRSSSCRCSPCWASPGRRGGHDWRLIPVVPALFAFAWGASNSPPEEAARPRPRLAELRRARNHRRGRSGPGREGGHRSLDGDRSRARRGEPPSSRRAGAITNAAPAVGPLASLHLQRVLPRHERAPGHRAGGRRARTGGAPLAWQDRPDEPPSTARSSARRIVHVAEPGNRPGSHDAPGARP